MKTRRPDPAWLCDNGAVRAHWKPGLLRGIGAGLLLQLNLLGIAALHHHDDFNFVAGRAPASAGSQRGTPAPAASDWTLCPVCQIMRLSAARLAAASNAQQSVRCLYLVLGPLSVFIPSELSAVVYGRASPLS
ncbi:MAG TPA: hypothetical protein VL523_07960 [Terriglobia bacterium]|nr:hypothetical protein [Terriglobia bacterium]